MGIMESDKNTRRRGDLLTNSIYDATEKLIKEVGYANLTFRQIAQAANTSRSVLYRRWATTFDLIQEIKQYKTTAALEGNIIDKIKDTGSLREDLLWMLTLYKSAHEAVGREIMNAYLFEMSQNNEQIADTKTRAVDSNIITITKVLEFAKARGEKVKEVSSRTLLLPFDLIRMEDILRKDTIDKKYLELLIEEVLLPVFKV